MDGAWKDYVLGCLCPPALLCGPGASPPAKPELLYGGVFRATRAELMPMNQNHVNSKFSFPSIPLHSCLQECLKVICPQGHRSVKRLFFRRYAWQPFPVSHLVRLIFPLHRNVLGCSEVLFPQVLLPWQTRMLECSGLSV